MIIIYIMICIALVALGLGIAAFIKAGNSRGPPGPPGDGGAAGAAGADGPDGGGTSPDDLLDTINYEIEKQLTASEYVTYGNNMHAKSLGASNHPISNFKKFKNHMGGTTCTNPINLCASKNTVSSVYWGTPSDTTLSSDVVWVSRPPS
jgi:hypothetical protein